MIPLSWKRFQLIMMRTKVATYDDYCDDTYAIKSRDDYIYKACHDYDYHFY